MNPAQFIAKWSRVDLPERAASQEHFLDLCRLLAQPTPAEHDATGAEFTFEKGVRVTGPASRGSQGDRGFVDVWWRGKFAWEYKRKGKYATLDDAYRQLRQYVEDLENPPLLIVSDIGRVEIHTNFTGTRSEIHRIDLAELDQPRSLDLLRRVFTDPDSFRTIASAEAVTEEIARHIGEIAQSLRRRGHDAHTAAHFLMKCMFCMFAEDIRLLPERVFTRLLERLHAERADLRRQLTELFDRMRTGGYFGPERVPFFNGGLFDGSPALELSESEAKDLLVAARQDWSAVEPAIFGTLFERSLDPSKRAQIGAHYTSRDDIMLVIEPVILMPLRREWAAVQEEVARQLDRRRKAKTNQTKNRANRAIETALRGFLDRLGAIRILDPACGSGNFLYVAIQQLLYLEKEVIRYAAQEELGVGLFPTVRPTQLHGLEINAYAAELAQVVIWIGYLQWMHDNGFRVPTDPILEPLQTIECRDAILDLSDPTHPKPSRWPDADFIVGNPPFLGSKLFRQQGLDDTYIQAMFEAYEIPNSSDLCCYWFERARQEIERRPHVRAGLLATQGIRGGANRTVLQRIKETGDIFMAWADREWILDGAAVHVSLIGFDRGQETERRLDDRPLQAINADLSADVDTTLGIRLPENRDISFMAGIKVGAFDIAWQQARHMLGQPNPNGRPNFDVLRPWTNGLDIARRLAGNWIIDFGVEEAEAVAAGYEAPFAHVEREVKPKRIGNRQPRRAHFWWLHGDVGARVRHSVLHLPRYLATPLLTKHRMFAWLDRHFLPDHQLIVFARSDDYFFGVLHSSIHELWARRMGTQLREAESGFRYTPTTCFETFPLPWPPGEEPTVDSPSPPRGEGGGEGSASGAQRGPDPHPIPLPGRERGPEFVRRIAAAAKTLNDQRERWLNPPEWIEPIARAVDLEDDFHDIPVEARKLIRQSAIMAKAAKDPNLKKRTLTNLYNERPTWLRLAHLELDRAVLAAYAHMDPEGGWDESWAEVWEETGAGQPLPEGHPLAARRAEVDQKVLANLLRLNLARAGSATEAQRTQRRTR